MRQDLPNSPSELSILSLDNQSAHLTWKRPTRDGGAPILSYVVQKRLLKSEEWENCGFLNPLLSNCVDQPEYQVKLHVSHCDSGLYS